MQVLKKSDGSAVFVSKTEEIPEKQFFVIYLEKELEEKVNYIVNIKFQGVLNDQLKGFYRSTYKDATGSDKLVFNMIK